jgi:hypothetical protein
MAVARNGASDPALLPDSTIEEGRVSEGKRILRQAFKDLERELPERVARVVRSLRHPDARWVRIPVGLLAVVGGIFSFLPVLGIWMLPLGLLLLAYDIPFLRKPVGRFTIWGAWRWARLRRSVARRWRGGADRAEPAAAENAGTKPHGLPIARGGAGRADSRPAHTHP